MRLTNDLHDANTAYADLERGEDFDEERAQRWAIAHSRRCIEVYVDGHYSRAFMYDLHAAPTVAPGVEQQCNGEAHSNAHIDYCSLCMSRDRRHARSVQL